MDGHVVTRLVEGVGYFVQGIVELDNRIRLYGLSVNRSHQLTVGSQSEAQALLLTTMREDGHLFLIGSRIQHHVNRKALARQVAAALGHNNAQAGEAQRC